MSSPITQEQKDKVRRRLTFDIHDESSSTLNSIKQPASNTHTSTTDQLPTSEDPQIGEQQKKEKMERWNFDFENEVPLPGPWEWVVIPRTRTTDHKEVVKTLEMEKEGCCDDRNV